jgi:DNA helicase-2/ATP-dependent DNA helicase PcrA
LDLNAEQKKIAVQEPKGHFLIKGVAGSGKTSVGIYRIAFLLNNYCFDKNDAILVATYNKTLIAYMSYLYDKLGSEELSTLKSLFAAPEGKVDIQTVDSLMHTYFRDYLSQNSLKYKLGPPKAMKYEIISEGISKLKKQYPQVTVLDPKNKVFLLEEIQWIKDCLYLEEEEYQSVDRIGKVKTGSENQPQRLAKNSETRKAIYELMLFYDDALRKRGYVSFSDMRIFALQQAQKNPKQKYSHIIVDESQDLTRAQLLFLKQIYNQKDYSSFAFIADTAQSIYAQSWLGTGRSFSSIGFNMVGRSYSLSKNFRTTTQISQAAYSLIENCREIVEDENFVKPALIDRQGRYPVLKSFPDETSQAEFISREIKKLLDTHPEKDIAIIARFKSQLESIKRFLESDGLKCGFFSREETTFETDSIKLITMHSIKGLEFRVVFIIGLDDRVLPYYSTSDPETRMEEELQERRLLYVGMTRATEMLYLTSSSSPSKFLSDIDPGYLRIDRQANLSRFYNIPTGDYRFKDKVANIHTTEEKIRQWMISELINTYNYPVSCIAVEYPVKEFSRKGFVDIAVQIYEQGRLTPFIFIETKSPGHSLQDGLDQLKSYMSHCRVCRYGVATNGNDVMVIDHEFKPLNDIPKFKNTMLSASLKNYSYLNFKTGSKYNLAIDQNDPSSLEVSNENARQFVEQQNMRKLPVYDRIAAGEPLEMNPVIEETFYFPKQWHRGADHFILKVRGDSMRNAGIEDNDYVVIRSQAVAENLDIAVVAIDNNATLKRFSRMGSNVLLLAENPKYDPIMLNEDQVSILGVAVGLVKQIN